MAYKWRPSRAKAREFAEKMDDVASFCREHGIDASASSDSYYFTIGGQAYRVSNHTIEASNAAARDPLTGERRRDAYHPGGRRSDVVYITASKTRLIEIYTALQEGRSLDSRGRIINAPAKGEI